MNLFLFFLTGIVAFLVVRIGAAAFELTGMEKDQSRFQALSCFSGTGFTTSEAELITEHPQRRKIAGYLMILGNVGLVTLIATFANSIRPVSIIEQFDFFSIPLPIPSYLSPYINIIIIIVGAYAIYRLFTRSKILDRFAVRIKRRMVEKDIIKQERVVDLLAVGEGYGLTQFNVYPDTPLPDQTLRALALKEKEVQVLMIQRGAAKIVAPKGHAKLELGDKLTCFGNLAKIRELAGAGPAKTG